MKHNSVFYPRKSPTSHHSFTLDGSVHDVPQVRWAFGQRVVHVHAPAEVLERLRWVSSDHVSIRSTNPEEKINGL